MVLFPMLADAYLLEIPKRLAMASAPGVVVVVAFRVVVVVRAVVVVVRAVVVVVSQILEWMPVRKKCLGPRKPEKEPPLLCLEGKWLRTDLLLPRSQC